MAEVLEGRVALVTGGRGGAGRAVCQRFVDEGAIVYAADLTDDGTIGGDPGAGQFLRFDVTSEAEVLAGFETIANEQGRLDIVVNAAGIEIEKTVEDTSLEEWNHIFAINVTGTYLTSKHALPMLRESNHASVSYTHLTLPTNREV